MRLTRRDLLAYGGGSAAATLLPACGPRPDGADTGADTAPEPAAPRPTEPADWEPDEGSLDAEVFPCAVSSGDVTSTTALLLVRTDAIELTLVLVAEQDGGWVEVQRLEGLAPQGDSARVELDGLTPDTAYRYVFLSGASRSDVGRFRTALADGATRQISFGATACLGGNRPWPTLSQAAAEQLDFFCLLGDTVYADGSLTLDDYRAVWRSAMGVRGMKDLVASTSLIATWDDHETIDNSGWDSVTEEQHLAAQSAMLESLPSRLGGTGDAGPAWWRSVRWGDAVEVFVLDCRGERLDGRYVSVAQMDWLKAGLSASPCRFKIVLNSVPITDFTDMIGDVEADDRWQGYPEQREEILSHVAGIGGVLWIAGDVHFGQIGWVDPPGGTGERIPEVYAGPGGSRLNPLALLIDPNEQYTDLVGVWSWTRFDLDPGLGTIRVRHFGDDGVAVTDRTLQL
jgi:phosphodiesterase/alkaline phosphatase D-like protein